MKQFLLLLFSGLSVISSSAQIQSPKTDQMLMQYFQNQEYGQAAVYLKILSSKDTLSSRYRSLLGYSYYMSNQLTEAGNCYNRMLAEDSTNTQALYYLGQINVEKGNRPQALDYFCHLIRLKPGVASYYKQLAILWSQLKNEPAAGYYYQKAYQLNPADPNIVTGLADYWISEEKYEEADSILDLALQKDSFQVQIRLTRARSAYTQKDYKAIFPYVSNLKKMQYLSLSPYLMKAVSYFELKKYDSCISVCEFLFANKLQTRTTVYLEALSYKELHQYKKSLEHWMNVWLWLWMKVRTGIFLQNDRYMKS